MFLQPKITGSIAASVLFFLTCYSAIGQIEVDNIGDNGSPKYLIEKVLLGNGVQLVNYGYKGDSLFQFGFFDNGLSTIGINSGIVFGTGDVENVDEPNISGTTSVEVTTGPNADGSDSDLEDIINTNTFDAAALEFDFVPAGDSIIFRYVFASEEYNEYVCSQFNDVFAFFIYPVNDPSAKKNVALIPGTSVPVSINNINNGTPGDAFDEEPECGGPGNPGLNNTKYYVDNENGVLPIEFDGFTVPMTAIAEVECGELYHIKMVIADVTDRHWDSGIFLEAESFYSPAITVEVESLAEDGTIIEDCKGAHFNFTRKDVTGTQVVHFDVAGDAIRGDSVNQVGIDYVLPQDSVVFLPGENQVTLSIFPLADGITEGPESVFITVYNISECGDTIPVTAELQVLDEVAIESTPISNSACSNDPAIVAVDVAGGTPDYLYLWENGATANQTIVSDTATSFFDVTITDAVGCFIVDSVELEVFPLPDITTNAGADTSICIGGQLQLVATGAVNYLWSPDSTLSDPNISNPIGFPKVDALYFVRGEDANGCLKTDSVQVTVHPLPELIKPGEPVEICANDSTTVQLNGGVSYSWSPGDGLSALNGSSVTIGPTFDRTYSITLTDANGCANTDNLAVIIMDPPTIDASGGTTICPEFSTQISATGGVSYLWSPSEYLDDESLENPTVTVSDTTQFTVTGTAANGCSNVDSVTVNTLAYPDNDAGKDTSICIGSSVELRGTGGLTYAWEPAASLNDSTQQNPIATPTDTTMYIMHILAAGGCIGRDTVMVNVNFPNITLGDSAVVCRGDSILLEVKHVNGLTWTPSTGLANPNQPATMAHPDVDTEYFITAIDTFGCANSDSIYVLVEDKPIVVVTDDVTLCIGDSVELAASGGLLYSWKQDSILNRVDSAVVVTFPKTSQFAVVEVTNAKQCNAVDSVLITVVPLPSLSLANDTIICSNSTSLLHVLPQTGNTYQWSPAIWLIDVNSSTPSVTPLRDTTYYVTGTDGNGCVNSDSINVQLQYAEVAIHAADTLICPEDEVLVVATLAQSYSWLSNGIIKEITNDSIVLRGLSTGPIVVTATDELGCQQNDTVTVYVRNPPEVDAGSNQSVCPGTTFTLSSSLASVYDWSPATNLTSPLDQTTNGTTSVNQQFHLTITDNFGCNNIDSVEIAVHQLQPLILTAVPEQICEGDSLLLGANFEITSWSDSTFWIDFIEPNHRFSPSQGHAVLASALDGNSCEVSTLYDFIVHPVPGLDLGVDTSLCLGSAFTLSPTTNGNTIDQVLWSPGILVADSTALNTTTTIEDTNQLVLMVADVNNCSTVDTINIEPLSVKVSTTDTAICRSSDFSISIASNFRGGSSFIWSPPSSVIGSTDSTAILATDSTQSIFLMVSDQDGCLDSATIELVILEPPVITVDQTLSPGCSSVEVHLSSESGLSSVFWIKDGATTEHPDFTFQVDYNASDSVMVVGESSNTCNSQFVHTTVIENFDAYFDIKMANVISPNGDGVNDWLEVNIKDQLHECIDMYIYNRWGELMFHSSGHNHTWDARTFTGETAPAGTYFYIIKVANNTLNGSLTVIRSE